MGNVFANKVLEFVGGYIEFVFVPPFVTEYQQMSAEAAVRRERKLVLSKLVCQIKSLDEKIAASFSKYERLGQDVRDQERQIVKFRKTPLGRQQAEFTRANYNVDLEAHKSISRILHLMHRTRAQLLIRQHIVAYAGESILLDTAFGSAGNASGYVDEFRDAVDQLNKAETKIDEIMATVEEEGGFFGTGDQRYDSGLRDLWKNLGRGGSSSSSSSSSSEDDDDDKAADEDKRALLAKADRESATPHAAATTTSTTTDSDSQTLLLHKHVGGARSGGEARSLRLDPRAVVDAGDDDDGDKILISLAS